MAEKPVKWWICSTSITAFFKPAAAPAAAETSAPPVVTVDSSEATFSTAGSQVVATMNVKFMPNWQRDWAWLELSAESAGNAVRGMICKYCRDAKKENVMASDPGCFNFRTSTLRRHAQSGEHRQAVLAHAEHGKMTKAQKLLFQKRNLPCCLLSKQCILCVSQMNVFNMGQILWFSYLICDEKKIPLPFEKSPLLFKWRGDFLPANPNPD